MFRPISAVSMTSTETPSRWARFDRPRFALAARIGATFAAISPLVLLLIRQFGRLGDRMIPCCDYAALDLGTRAFLRGEQFTGLYSRQGWRHPGPAPFLWNAPFRLVFGESLAAERIAMATLAIIAVGVVLWALHVRFPTRAYLIGCAVIMIWLARFDLRFLVEPWNPAMAMLWVLVTVAAASMVTSDGSHGPGRWIVVALAAGSMAVQSHLSATPAVAIAIAFVAVSWWRRRTERSMRTAAIVAAAVTVVLWALPLWDLAFGERNLWHILTVDESGYGGGFAWSTMLGNLVQILGLGPARQGFAFGAASPFLDSTSFDVTTVIVAIVSVALAVRLLMVRHRHHRCARLATISVGGLIVTSALLAISGGEYWPYVMLPIVGLGALLAASGLVAAAVDLPTDRLPSLRALTVGVGATVIAATFVVLLTQVPATFRADDYSTPALRDITERVTESCDRLPDPALVVIADAVAWTDAITIVAALERCTTVRVAGHIGFIAGEPYGWRDGDEPNVFVRPTGDSTVTGTVVARNDTFEVIAAPFRA